MEFVGVKDVGIRPIKEHDEVAMARFAWENPQYVQYELELFWKHDLEKKKHVKQEGEAGPSSVIPGESNTAKESSDPCADLFWNSGQSDPEADE